MLDLADIALLLAVLVVLTVSRVITDRRLRRDWAKVQKYKLYKVRDDLIMLVAKGKLSEDDFIFKKFYPTISFFIRKTHKITLANFVTVVGDMEHKGQDLAAKEMVVRIHKELESKDDEVSAAVFQFYHAVSEILVENSRSLRFYLFAGARLAPVKGLWRRIDPSSKFIPRRNVLNIYRRYSSAGGPTL